MSDKTYETVDGVNVGEDDEVWFAEPDLDSGNYLPVNMTAGKAVSKGQTALWSNYADCLNECEDQNSL